MTDGQEACVSYAVEPDGVWDVCHTYVPGPLRNQGLADALMRRLLETAARDGVNVRPTCGYARIWFDRHPEFAVNRA